MTRNRFYCGFGLVEVMVALAIGMIATVIMLQTLAVSESQKRTTTGAADAQNNGAISLISMERDIRMAGWGLQGSVFVGCTEFYTYKDGAAIDDNTTPGSSLVSVLEISDGGTGPDTITIRHFDNPASQDFRFSIARIASAQTAPADPFVVNNTLGCSTVGDLIVVSNGKQCTLAQVSAVDTTTKKISHDANAAYPYNAPSDDMAGWPKHDGTSAIECFPSFYIREYAVDTAHFRLQRTENGSTGYVSSGIMDVQAEYGIDNAAGGTDWVPATGDWENPDIDHIRQIKAARIAVLARSETFEKPVAGSTTCDTTDSLVGMSTWATFDPAGFPSDWKCYRYKAYEINMPLRNVIWSR